jgi:hypothetical protein
MAQVATKVHALNSNKIPITTAENANIWLGKYNSPTANRQDVLQAIVNANPGLTGIPVIAHMYPFQYGCQYYGSNGAPVSDPTHPGKYSPQIKPGTRTPLNWTIAQTVTAQGLQQSVAWYMGKLGQNLNTDPNSYAKRIGGGIRFDIVIGETGWASGGFDTNYDSYQKYVINNSTNKDLVTGTKADAAAYAQAVYAHCSTNNIPLMYFMAMDVPWKPGSENGIDNAEAFYGIFDTWGQIKPTTGSNNFYPPTGPSASAPIDYRNYTVMPIAMDANPCYEFEVHYNQGGIHVVDTSPAGRTYGANSPFTSLAILAGLNSKVQLYRNTKTISTVHNLTVVGTSTDPQNINSHIGGKWTPEGYENQVEWGDKYIKLPKVPPNPIVPGVTTNAPITLYFPSSAGAGEYKVTITSTNPRNNAGGTKPAGATTLIIDNIALNLRTTTTLDVKIQTGSRIFTGNTITVDLTDPQNPTVTGGGNNINPTGTVDKQPLHINIGLYGI